MSDFISEEDLRGRGSLWISLVPVKTLRERNRLTDRSSLPSHKWLDPLGILQVCVVLTVYKKVLIKLPELRREYRCQQDSQPQEDNKHYYALTYFEKELMDMQR